MDGEPNEKVRFRDTADDILLRGRQWEWVAALFMSAMFACLLVQIAAGRVAQATLFHAQLVIKVPALRPSAFVLLGESDAAARVSLLFGNAGYVFSFLALTTIVFGLLRIWRFPPTRSRTMAQSIDEVLDHLSMADAQQREAAATLERLKQEQALASLTTDQTQAVKRYLSRPTLIGIFIALMTVIGGVIAIRSTF